MLFENIFGQLAVDGNTTFDENLCDVEALEMVSRHALRSDAKSRPNIFYLYNIFRDTERQDELPGVNFTKDQTFFINLAQVRDYTRTSLQIMISSEWM